MIIFDVFIISHANDLKSNHHQMKPGDWKYMLTEVSSGVWINLIRIFITMYIKFQFFMYLEKSIFVHQNLTIFAILHFSIFSPTNLERKPQTQRVNMQPTFYIMLGLLRKFQTFFSIGLASFYKSGEKINCKLLSSNSDLNRENRLIDTIKYHYITLFLVAVILPIVLFGLFW